MITDEQQALQVLEPIIKIIKDRQLLYFQALAFANKNIESSSNDLDQLTIFNAFLHEVEGVESEIVTREALLFTQAGPNEDPPSEGHKIHNTSKQMMRLSARVLQLLQSSIQKARNTIFAENGKIGVDFTRFKKSLHRVIRHQLIDLSEFCTVIINFVKNKYRRQLNRIKTYLNRLQAGQHISLRDLFTKEGSDASVSPEDRPNKLSRSIRPTRKMLKQASPQAESPTKKNSLKRTIQGGCSSKPKRTLNLKTARRQQHQIQSVHQQKQKKIQKSATASLLLKFYAMMDLSKKQFLEDYVFEKYEQQKQRKKLMFQLMQRNHKNSQQIKQYFSRCQNFNPSLHNLHLSSDQNQQSSVQRNQSSANSRMSLRTSFVISKRKGSFVFQSGSDRSDAQHNHNNLNIPFSRTIKNFSSTKRVQEKRTPRPKPSNNSKKIFVIKSPMTFDDQIIPKAEISNLAWIQPPLTGRERTTRKNQHIRLKKKNNPVPLDQKYLPQSFRLSQYPI